MPKREADLEAGRKENAKKSGPQVPFQATACPPVAVMLNPICWILWLIDFVLWVLQIPFFIFHIIRRCTYRYSYTDDNEEEDETRRRTADLWEDGLITGPTTDDSDDEDPEALTTSWEIAEETFKKHADLDCFGTRQFLRMDDGKRVFGDTDWLTYAEVSKRARNFGTGLRKLGMQPLPQGQSLETSNGAHTMLLFEDTSANWLTAMLGAHSQSLVVATSYSTLGIASVTEAIKECNISVVVCNRKNVEEVAKASGPSLKHIVYTHHYVTPEECATPLRFNHPNISATFFDDLISSGAQVQGAQTTPPHSSNLAVIMYTSGSTGKPKGVMIAHSNLAASTAALASIMHYKGQHSYVAYLPAAHIFELCAEFSHIHLGSAIGFADPKTLTEAGAKRERDDGTLNEEPGEEYPPGALQEFKPTMMVAVPVVWDIFKKKAEDTVGKLPCIVRHLFCAAYSAQCLARSLGTNSIVLRFLAFKKLRAAFGGNMVLGVSGGGPLSSAVQDFVSTAYCFPLVQGYGLTETTCCGSAQEIWDVDTGCLGGPKSSVEVKLRDCDGAEDPTDPEGNQYLTQDDEHKGKPCNGRGEIMIRGPSLSQGYFKMPEETRKAWPDGKEGFFRTGDIGLWDTKGRLQIVDRLKNLVKLKGGEYVAIENMEKEYNTSPFVSAPNGGIMCYGDGDMTRPGALVQVAIGPLKNWANGAGVDTSDIVALCKNKAAEKAVLESLISCAKGKLSTNEKLVAVRLIPGTGPGENGDDTSPWSAENETLTPSRKLNRKIIQKVWATVMESMKEQCK